MAHTVLVAGATGTVGSAAVEALADGEGNVEGDADGDEGERRDVRILGGTRSPASADLPAGVEPTAFDFARPETWGPALDGPERSDGVDRLFLLLPPGEGRGRVADVAAAADRTGVERVVFLSVLGADRLPVLPHRRVERRLAALEADAVFLRAAHFMQNLAEVHAPEIRDRDEVFVPAGSGRLSFVDARDVGAVAARELLAPAAGDRAYDLTGPTALDHGEVAAMLSDVLDRRITYPAPSPLRFARLMRRERELPLPLVAVMVVLYTSARVGFGDRVTDGVERALGRPPTRFRTFAEDYREVWSA